MMSIEQQSITQSIAHCVNRCTVSWGQLITSGRRMLSEDALLLLRSRGRGRQCSRSTLMCSGGEVSHKAHLSTEVPGLLCHLVNSRVQRVTFLLPSSLRAEEEKQGRYLLLRDRGACTGGHDPLTLGETGTHPCYSAHFWSLGLLYKLKEMADEKTWERRAARNWGVNTPRRAVKLHWATVALLLNQCLQNVYR